MHLSMNSIHFLHARLCLCVRAWVFGRCHLLLPCFSASSLPANQFRNEEWRVNGRLCCESLFVLLVFSYLYLKYLTIYDLIINFHPVIIIIELCVHFTISIYSVRKAYHTREVLPPSPTHTSLYSTYSMQQCIIIQYPYWRWNIMSIMSFSMSI